MRPLYQTQRLMRGIRKAALQRGVVAILDLGQQGSPASCSASTGPSGATRLDGVGPWRGRRSSG
jgi:cell division protein FtsA